MGVLGGDRHTRPSARIALSLTLSLVHTCSSPVSPNSLTLLHSDGLPLSPARWKTDRTAVPAHLRRWRKTNTVQLQGATARRAAWSATDFAAHHSRRRSGFPPNLASTWSRQKGLALSRVPASAGSGVCGCCWLISPPKCKLPSEPRHDMR